MTARSIKDEIVVGGLVDWTDASWAVQAVRSTGLGDSGLLHFAAIGVIAEMLAEGLVVAGDIEGGKHVPWACTVGEAVERIIDKWQREFPDGLPRPWAIVWLDNTREGDERARAVLANEGGDPQ